MDITHENQLRMKTFVFLSIKTTSFGKRARIMEISMVAISREDLLGMKLYSSNASGPYPIPRAIQKYTRFYYPGQRISLVTEEATGLSNDFLGHLPTFTKNSASDIKSFLQLPRPVCLVSHNGSTFAFPILNAELLRVCFKDMKGIVCVDTLPFTRFVEKEEIATFTELAKTFQNSDRLDDRVAPKISSNSSKPYHSLVTNKLPAGSNKKYPNCKQSDQIFQTPQKLSTISNLSSQVPSKRNPVVKDAVSPQPIKKSEVNCHSGKKSIKRQLLFQFSYTGEKNFVQKSACKKIQKNSHLKKCAVKNISMELPKGNSDCKTLETVIEDPVCSQQMQENFILLQNVKRSSQKPMLYEIAQVGKKPFTQRALFHRLFREDYDCERAESSSMSLMQVCAFHGNIFCIWADTYFRPLQLMDGKRRK